MPTVTSYGDDPNAPRPHYPYPDEAPDFAAAKGLVMQWAKSEGFAAIHNGAAEGRPATDDQIADDFLRWVTAQGWILTLRWPK